MRYKNESKEKANGVVYTPKQLADYLSNEMIKYSKFDFSNSSTIRVLDPAVGEGELLVSLISSLMHVSDGLSIDVFAFETDEQVARQTKEHLSALYPNISIEIIADDFLNVADTLDMKFDFIIANPPYIRTQILGADKAQVISKKMKLSGRVDIYYDFWKIFIDFVEANNWSFGGGMKEIIDGYYINADGTRGDPVGDE